MPCLDAVRARHVVEVGADGGDLTRSLLERAVRVGGTVTAVDPTPGEPLREMAERERGLRLIARPSQDALGELAEADAVILDGDHNYHTVSVELRTLADGREHGRLPLIVLHDVGWPHARRDTYYDPERIPASARQPYVRDAKLRPGHPGIAERGLPFGCAAEREGGPSNGVLTAIEDFLRDHDELRFERVPLFWGIGFVWWREAPWATALATALAPWAANPVLERLEAHRVSHLVELCAAEESLAETRGLSERRAEVMEAQSELLARMLGSGAFAVAERLSRLHQRGEPIFSRSEIEEVLGISGNDREMESRRREAASGPSSGGGRATSPAPSAAS